MSKYDLFLMNMPKEMANKEAGFNPKNPNGNKKKTVAKKTAAKKAATKKK